MAYWRATITCLIARAIFEDIIARDPDRIFPYYELAIFIAIAVNTNERFATADRLQACALRMKEPFCLIRRLRFMVANRTGAADDLKTLENSAGRIARRLKLLQSLAILLTEFPLQAAERLMREVENYAGMLSTADVELRILSAVDRRQPFLLMRLALMEKARFFDRGSRTRCVSESSTIEIG